MTARYAGGSIMLGGIDILAGLSIGSGEQGQNVLAFSYSDNTSDLADDLTVDVADPARTWLQSYVPAKGAECNAIIKVRNWSAPGDNREFDCGAMWVDEIGLAGPPNTVTVKAVSVPVSTGFKTQKQYQFWEGQPLQAVAAEIAGLYGLGLVWDTPESPTLKRTDVIEMAHLEYLRDRAKDDGLSIKVFNRQLIIYSEEEYESRGAVYTLTYGMSQILAYGFVSRLNDTYARAENAYVSPETGKLIEGEFEPPTAPEGSGSILKLNQRVEEGEEGEGGNGEGPFMASPRVDAVPIDYINADAAASDGAIRVARSKLREKNKREKEAFIAVVGNPGYISGLCMGLTGFGAAFDGTWFIKATIHTISEDGYVTELRIRKTLEGY